MSEVYENINELAAKFANDQDKAKFETLSVLSFFFASVRDTEGAAALVEKALQRKETWPGDIGKGVFTILSSRVGAKERCCTLSVASTMLGWFGPSWAIANRTDTKFVELMIQHARIEIGVLLKSSPTATEDVEIEQRRIQTLLSSYELLEYNIEYLTMALMFDDNEAEEVPSFVQDHIKEGAMQWSKFPAEVLLRMMTAIHECMTVVLEFLQSIEEGSANQLLVDPSFRIIALWLAEESEALRAEVYATLSILLKLSNSAEKVEMILPGLYNIAMQEEGCQALIDAGAITFLTEELARSAGERREQRVSDLLERLS